MRMYGHRTLRGWMKFGSWEAMEPIIILLIIILHVPCPLPYLKGERAMIFFGRFLETSVVNNIYLMY